MLCIDNAGMRVDEPLASDCGHTQRHGNPNERRVQCRKAYTINDAARCDQRERRNYARANIDVERMVVLRNRMLDGRLVLEN